MLTDTGVMSGAAVLPADAASPADACRNPSSTDSGWSRGVSSLASVKR